MIAASGETSGGAGTDVGMRRAALYHAIDAPPVFVPQQPNRAAFARGTRARPWTPNDPAVPGLMTHLNRILEASCTGACAFAADVARERYATGDFVDEGHVGRGGATKFAQGARAHARTWSARERALRARAVRARRGW